MSIADVAGSLDTQRPPSVVIAEFISHMRTRGPNVRHQANRALVDGVAVSIAGSREEATERVATSLQARLRESGDCSLIGRAERSDEETAALHNGVAGHILDYDDVYWPGRVHPTATSLPVVLALTEGRRVTGSRALDALATGIEVTCALSEWFGREHYDRGWHTTSTVGTLGATAAAASLLDLSVDATETALGLASSLSSGVQANFGTMAKALHVGWSAAAGIRAARLAACGFTSSPDALAGARGLAEASGSGRHGEALSRLGRESFMDSPSYLHKTHAACSLAHPAIDAAVSAVKDGVKATDILEIQCVVTPEAKAGLPFNRPGTPLEAKFSLPYCIAATLVAGKASLEQFTPAFMSRPDIQALLSRVAVTEDVMDNEEAHGASLRLVATSGKVTIKRSQGVGAIPALTDEDLRQKFLDCVGPVMGERAAGHVLEDLWNISDAADAGLALSSSLGTFGRNR